MRILFLVNNAEAITRFSAKIAEVALAQGDECIVLVHSKMAEYARKPYFPEGCRFVLKPQWCRENWKTGAETFEGFSWREFFPIFDRYAKYLPMCNFSFARNMVSQEFQMFKHIFDQERPDVVVGEPPTGLMGKVGYFFANANRIPYIGMTEARINGRVAMHTLEWTDPAFEKTFRELTDQDITAKEKLFAENWIADFVSHRAIPESTQTVKLRFGPIEFFVHYIHQFRTEGVLIMRYILERNSLKGFDYESEAVVRSSVRQPFLTFWRQIKISLQKKFFQAAIPGDAFFVYPLHVQPEASTSVLATYFSDQLNTIKNIAFALPFPYKLYVKEHPSSLGKRNNEFYRELKRLPQVVLIRADEPASELIKNSCGVITLSGTMGLEALFVGKPTYLLGSTFYSYHPFCRNVRSFTELKKHIEKDVYSSIGISELENINLHFVVSYMRNVTLGSIGQALSENDSNDYARILQSIRQRVISFGDNR